jgi:hypothetical protein
MQILCRNFFVTFYFFLDFCNFLGTLNASVENFLLILFFLSKMSKYKEKCMSFVWITLLVSVDKRND